MTTFRTPAASAMALSLVLAACAHAPGAQTVVTAPSPAETARTAGAALGLPPADVDRASLPLARQVAGWDQPQRTATRQEPRRVSAAVLAATFNSAEAAAARVALDSVITSGEKPIP